MVIHPSQVFLATVQPDMSIVVVRQIKRRPKRVGRVKSVFTGRKGWMRRVPDYKLKAVTLEKEI